MSEKNQKKKPKQKENIHIYWSTYKQPWFLCVHLWNGTPGHLHSRPWGKAVARWLTRVGSKGRGSHELTGQVSQAEGGHSNGLRRKHTEEVGSDQSQPDHWKLPPSGWVMVVLIGLCIRMGVVPPRRSQAFDEEFFILLWFNEQVTGGSWQGHGDVTTESLQGHGDVRGSPWGHQRRSLE